MRVVSIFAFLSFLLNSTHGFSSYDSWLVGPELTIEIPKEHESWSLFPLMLAGVEASQLNFNGGTSLNTTPPMLWLKDQNTNAIFNLVIDKRALEVRTPPLLRSQFKTVLKPIFQLFKNLGWKFGIGGGHFHVDLEVFKKNPIKFVNLLIALHNNPLSEKIFLPVEGEPTLYQRGHQKFFIERINLLKKIKTPKWSDIESLFKDLYSDKPGSLIFHDTTIEFRALGSQESIADLEANVFFYETLWNSCSDDKIDTPTRWNNKSFFQEISPYQANRRLKKLLSKIRIQEKSLSRFDKYISYYKYSRLERFNSLLKKPKAKLLEYLDLKIPRRFYKDVLIENLNSDYSYDIVTAYRILLIKKWVNEPDLVIAVLSHAFDGISDDKTTYAWDLLQRTGIEPDSTLDKVIKKRMLDVCQNLKEVTSLITFAHFNFYNWQDDPLLLDCIFNVFLSKYRENDDKRLEIARILILNKIESPSVSNSLVNQINAQKSRTTLEWLNLLKDANLSESKILREEIIKIIKKLKPPIENLAILRRFNWSDDPELFNYIFFTAYKSLTSDSETDRVIAWELMSAIPLDKLDSTYSLLVELKFEDLLNAKQHRFKKTALTYLDLFDWRSNPRLKFLVESTFKSPTLLNHILPQISVDDLDDSVPLQKALKRKVNPKKYKRIERAQKFLKMIGKNKVDTTDYFSYSYASYLTDHDCPEILKPLAIGAQ